MTENNSNRKYLEDFYSDHFKDLALGKYKGVLSYRNLKKISKKSHSSPVSPYVDLLIDLLRSMAPIFLIVCLSFLIGVIREDLSSAHSFGLMRVTDNLVTLIQSVLLLACILAALPLAMRVIVNFSKGKYRSSERVRFDSSYRDYRNSEFLKRYLEGKTESDRREFLNSEEGKNLLFALLDYR